MNRLLCCVCSLLLLSGVATAQQARLGVKLSTVPIWPADGSIPANLSERYVFLDPAKNELVIAYPRNLGKPGFESDPGPLHLERLDLGDAVQASVGVSVELAGGQFAYNYRVANAAHAQSPIRAFSLAAGVLAGNDQAEAPRSWSAARGATGNELVSVPTLNPAGMMLSWRTQGAGIAPGNELTGFQVTSALKPGFLYASIRGRELPVLPEGMPQAVVQQAALALRSVRSSQVLTIGPKYTADTPLLPIVSDYHSGLSSLVRQGLLVEDSPAVRETLEVLGRYLAAAAEQPDVPLEEWVGPPLIITATPRPGVEANILNAVRLVLQ